MVRSLPTTDQPLEIGARSTFVARLQMLLSAKGYAGPIDGLFGVPTQHALHAAVFALEQSPCYNARSIVASRSYWPDAGTATNALAQAFQLDADQGGVASAGTAAGLVLDAPPLGDPRTIVMGPTQAVALRQKLGLDPKPPMTLGAKVAIGSAAVATLGLVTWGLSALARR